jgi:hypothetical protein
VLVTLEELPLSDERRRNQVIFEYHASEESLLTDGIYVGRNNASHEPLATSATLDAIVEPTIPPKVEFALPSWRVAPAGC